MVGRPRPEVKSVEEGAVAMFTEDIRKSMRWEQSTLESRYGWRTT
jgi:hypothetical protein